MFKLGQKILYYGREALILVYSSQDKEVLICTDECVVKWVDEQILKLNISA